MHEYIIAGAGTFVGTVVELFGGRANGRSCPKANLTTYERWIEKLNPKLKMRDLVLPGSHHHGLVEGASSYIGLIPGDKVLDWADTQSLSAADQLRTGARFLDIRLTVYEGILCTAHGQKSQLVTVGVPFYALLNVNIEFLKKNRKEFLVWSFRWEYGKSEWGQVEALLKKHKEYFYTSDVSPMGRDLIDLAGKIIICKQGKDKSLPEYRKLACSGSWFSTRHADPRKLVERLLQYAQLPKYPKGTIFNFIEAIATVDLEEIIESLNHFTEEATDLKSLACRTNKVLKDSFLIKEYRRYTDNFHAVMVDYSVYHQVIPGILEFNNYKNKIRIEGEKVVNIDSNKKGKRCPLANLETHERWMEDLNPNLKLKDLVLPGTHHSGLVEGIATYKGKNKHGGDTRLLWAVTQSLKVKDQMRTGVRFLDVRLAWINNNINTAHGADDNTFTSGVFLLWLLADSVEFLRKNNREFLVWSLTWEYGSPEWARVEKLLNKFKQHIYISSDNPMDEPLPVLAGKIIICNKGEDNLLKYRRLPCVGSWSMTRQGDPNMLVENILEYSRSPQYPRDVTFNYVEAVATGNMKIGHDLKDVACKVNKKLKESFLTRNNIELSENIHAVMVDYSAYHDVIPAILEFNNYKNSIRDSTTFL